MDDCQIFIVLMINYLMTKIFLDTEFTGLHQNTTLISLALVAETGEEFYTEFNDFDRTMISEWIEENVISKLEMAGEDMSLSKNKHITKIKSDHAEIKKELQIWLQQFEGIEIWADVLAYDWVLFCELFGGALNIPDNIFYAPFDLATFFRMKGIVEPVNKFSRDVSRFEFAGVDAANQHNSLVDARTEMLCFKKLSQMQ